MHRWIVQNKPRNMIKKAQNIPVVTYFLYSNIRSKNEWQKYSPAFIIVSRETKRII